MDDTTIDQHSVTCAICGELADEKRTVPITSDEEIAGPSMVVESPHRWAAMVVATEELGESEAHQTCFERFADEEVPLERKAFADLDAIEKLSTQAENALDRGDTKTAAELVQMIYDTASQWSEPT